MQYDLSELKKCDFKENIFIMLQCRTTNWKIGTEESQIETSIELSERVNLLIKQNTYFLSNSPNDFILSCTNISLALLYFGMPNNLRRLIICNSYFSHSSNSSIIPHSRTIHIRTERFEQSTFHIWGTLSKLPR